MKRFVLIAAVILVMSSLLQAQTLKFAIGDWEPYTSQTDEKSQFCETIVKEALEQVGPTPEYGYFPWKRSYEISKDGTEWIGSFPWQKTSEREGEFYFSDPLFEEKEVFFHLKDLEFNWEKPEDLKKYKLGGSNGYSHVDKMIENGIEPDVAANIDINLKKVLGKRIDAYPDAFLVGYYKINKLFPPEKAALFTNHPKAWSDTQYYIIFSKNNPASTKYLEKFNEGLKKLKESGRYQEIVDKFIES